MESTRRGTHLDQDDFIWSGCLQLAETPSVLAGMVERTRTRSQLGWFGTLDSNCKMKKPQKFEGGAVVGRQIKTLACFLSKSTKNLAPIFQCLRKEKHFRWIDECETTFQELKTMLASPPILTQGSSLSITLTKSYKEQSYDIKKIEKAALTIVITTKKLGPYFQSHPVICRTVFSIRQILRKRDLVGRMIGWTIKLSEFDIAFERRGHMKAQVLADFINELTPNSHEEEATRANREWTLS
ncbi:hypothetical protein CR513_22087, partial [Mucuna pruriens]